MFSWSISRLALRRAKSWPYNVKYGGIGELGGSFFYTIEDKIKGEGVGRICTYRMG